MNIIIQLGFLLIELIYEIGLGIMLFIELIYEIGLGIMLFLISILTIIFAPIWLIVSTIFGIMKGFQE